MSHVTLALENVCKVLVYVRWTYLLNSFIFLPQPFETPLRAVRRSTNPLFLCLVLCVYVEFAPCLLSVPTT